jgi:hypothetical protein
MEKAHGEVLKVHIAAARPADKIGGSAAVAVRTLSRPSARRVT